nr:hypothetical protein [Tanacetum cinerariifolium]
MIKEKLAVKEQVDSLKQNLSKQIKEKECLLQTFTAFKRESKEKEDENIENEMDLEKKIKKLDNIIFKVGQSTHTVHMLTKPQGFYDNIHKQAIGYQNPFYLKKAQRIKPTLYDGAVGNKMHKAFPLLVRKFPLPEGTSHCLKKNASARRKVMPLPEDCTARLLSVLITLEDPDLSFQQVVSEPRGSRSRIYKCLMEDEDFIKRSRSTLGEEV